MSNSEKLAAGIAAHVPDLEEEARAILVQQGSPAAAPAGTVLFRPGEACERLVLLAKGSVRVRMISDTGREIELYRVLPGETCVLSVACLMSARNYEAEGVAETELSGLAVGRATFRQLLERSAAFREMVLAVQTRRIYDLIARLDEVAFHNTEARLAAHLLQRRDGSQTVAETHQALADEIGTAREVVSRRLKRLESAGIVALERGRVRIVDAARLKQMAGE